MSIGYTYPGIALLLHLPLQKTADFVRNRCHELITLNRGACDSLHRTSPGEAICHILLRLQEVPTANFFTKISWQSINFRWRVDDRRLHALGRRDRYSRLLGLQTWRKGVNWLCDFIEARLRRRPILRTKMPDACRAFTCSISMKRRSASYPLYPSHNSHNQPQQWRAPGRSTPRRPTTWCGSSCRAIRAG